MDQVHKEFLPIKTVNKFIYIVNHSLFEICDSFF